jgi:predicted signal transduction protein with EAL and GGDEF domain
MVERADYALYYAKANRRGTAVLFTEEHERLLRTQSVIDLGAAAVRQPERRRQGTADRIPGPGERGRPGPAAGYRAEVLVERADYALYYAKANRRGTAVLFTEEHLQRASASKAIVRPLCTSTIGW